MKIYKTKKTNDTAAGIAHFLLPRNTEIGTVSLPAGTRYTSLNFPHTATQLVLQYSTTGLCINIKKYPE